MAEDPVRLFDEPGSELLKSLLSAAREEQPLPAALPHTLAAIGVSSAAIATASAASIASAASLGSAKSVASSTLLIVIKWLGLGALAGIVTTSTLYAVSQPDLPAPSTARTAAVHVTAAVALAPAPPPAAPAAAAEHAAPTLSAAPVAALPVTSNSPAAPAAQPLSAPAEVDPGQPLAAELALLDNARQALAAGNAARALRFLNDYDTRFVHPNLAPEALYLRLETLTLQGDKAGTAAVARHLLRSYPSGPHAARARSVLGLDQ
ncbi:MAG: hypothetical protein ABW061_08110 [Polyangiaceae bacterium]